jgi:hypothetical protein
MAVTRFSPNDRAATPRSLPTWSNVLSFVAIQMQLRARRLAHSRNFGCPPVLRMRQICPMISMISDPPPDPAGGGHGRSWADSRRANRGLAARRRSAGRGTPAIGVPGGKTPAIGVPARVRRRSPRAIDSKTTGKHGDTGPRRWPICELLLRYGLKSWQLEGTSGYARPRIFRLLRLLRLS